MRFDELKEGAAASLRRVLTPELHEAVLRTFGDRNPLHTDDAYARARGFQGRLAHGTAVAGMISELVGLHLPGPGCLEHSMTLEFQSPVYVGDALLLTAELAQKSEAARTVVVKISVLNETTGKAAAAARVQAGVLE